MASIVQKKKNASLNYVNNLLVLSSVKLATTANLEATYSNGTSGIGATLTSSSSETLTIDSVSPTVGSRILVKDQSTAAENGIYSVTNTGGESSSYVLTRTSDFNTLTTIKLSDFVFIDSGTTHQGQGFVMIGDSSFDGTLDGEATIGTTSITFTQFTGISSTIPVSKGGTGQTSYTNGQILIGNTSGNTLSKATLTEGSGISITNGNGSITIASSGTSYTAGDGLNLTETSFSTDLKVDGGLVIESTELAVKLDATSITGTLAIGDGGTGATTAAHAASALGVGTEDSPSFSGLNLHNDSNNADTTLSIGTSATECLNIVCLNGDSNKTAEHIQFISKTASGTTDHGKISFHIDDSESSILDITDTGIFVGTDEMFGASVGNLGVGMETSGTEGQIDATGDIIAFSSSDKRLKTNIQPIQDPLTKLQKIGGYTFDWIPKEGIHSHTGNDIGVIAQEIEEVLPEVTTTRENGYKAVKYEKLTAYLIECVKAQQTHIQQLEDRLVKLEKND